MSMTFRLQTWYAIARVKQSLHRIILPHLHPCITISYFFGAHITVSWSLWRISLAALSMNLEHSIFINPGTACNEVFLAVSFVFGAIISWDVYIKMIRSKSDLFERGRQCSHNAVIIKISYPFIYAISKAWQSWLYNCWRNLRRDMIQHDMIFINQCHLF